MIIHLTSDLMATSGLTAAARAKDLPVKLVTNPKKVAEVIENNRVALLIIDLQTNGLDIREFVGALPTTTHVPLLAYAQHVREQLINEAEESGIENVMSRGQFQRALADIVAKAASEMNP